MPRLTQETKDRILADWHIGKSQNSIAIEYECSPATVNKLCKGIEPKYKEKVNTVISIKSELARENQYQSESFDKEVNKKLKYLLFFQDAAIRNQLKADGLLDDTQRMSDVESHSRITKNNKETVLGKTADSVVEDNEEQQTTEIVITLDSKDD